MLIYVHINFVYDGPIVLCTVCVIVLSLGDTKIVVI
jgi:hypothetical protein